MGCGVLKGYQSLSNSECLYLRSLESERGG